MRLTEFEIESIKETVLQLDPKAEIYLFGSRTNNSLAGGDIDLLVLSESLDFTHKIDMLVDIKDSIGDQKVDLLIKNKKQVESEAFLQDILPEAVRL
ncbi:MAG: nucleotidyltransferase domain-containing protein [Bdellovibrionales bacterium]